MPVLDRVELQPEDREKLLNGGVRGRGLGDEVKVTLRKNELVPSALVPHLPYSGLTLDRVVAVQAVARVTVLGVDLRLRTHTRGVHTGGAAGQSNVHRVDLLDLLYSQVELSHEPPGSDPTFDLHGVRVRDNVGTLRPVKHWAFAHDDALLILKLLHHELEIFHLSVALAKFSVRQISGQSFHRRDLARRILDLRRHLGALFHHALEADFAVADAGNKRAPNSLLGLALERHVPFLQEVVEHDLHRLADLVEHLAALDALHHVLDHRIGVFVRGVALEHDLSGL